jgi:hypothetical protein
VSQKKAKLCSASSRCRSSYSRGSSAARNLDVRAALDLNAAESRSRAWYVLLSVDLLSKDLVK